MEDAMQLTPLASLIRQCTAVTGRLEQLQVRNHRYNLFAISGLNEDLQRVYAVELILMHLERRTRLVQQEVAEAITELLETIGVTYGR